MDWYRFLFQTNKRVTATVCCLLILLFFWTSGREEEDLETQNTVTNNKGSDKECTPCKECNCPLPQCPLCDNRRPIVIYQDSDLEGKPYQYSQLVIEPINPKPISSADNYAGFKQNKKSRINLLSIWRVPEETKRIYVDLGSGNCNGSIVSWFLQKYPQADQFEIHAFEAKPMYAQTYKTCATSVPIDFQNVAVYTKDTELTYEGVTVKAIDLAKWMRANLSPEDFVVARMDIGGYERDVIPYLLQDETLFLFDELFLECHYFGWTTKNPEWTREYCVEMFYSLREAGLFVHEWF